MSWYTLGTDDNFYTFGYDLAAQDGILEPFGGSGLVAPIEGFVDYGNVHCNGEMFSWDRYSFDIYPNEIADIIREHELWDGQDIRILACEAGKIKYGAAYELAVNLGVRVLAPISLVHINDRTGEMYVLDCSSQEIPHLIEIDDIRITPEWQSTQWVLFPMDE